MIEFMWKQIERALALWRTYRSALHARIAWAVVLAGTAVMVTPWWLPILAQLLKSNTNLDVTGLDTIAASTEPLYGLIAIALGLAYHGWTIWYTAREQAAARVKVVAHDKAIFEGLTDIVGESELKEFLQRMLGDHSYFDPDVEMLDRAVEHMQLASNSYVDDDLNGAVQVLRQRFDELVRFLGTEFDFYPPTQNFPRGNKYCMRPHWNIDRAGHGNPDEDRKYDECVTRLHELSSAAMAQYEKAILIAKKQHV